MFAACIFFNKLEQKNEMKTKQTNEKCKRSKTQMFATCNIDNIRLTKYNQTRYRRVRISRNRHLTCPILFLAVLFIHVFSQFD